MVNCKSPETLQIEITPSQGYASCNLERADCTWTVRGIPRCIKKAPIAKTLHRSLIRQCNGLKHASLRSSKSIENCSKQTSFSFGIP